MVDHFYLTFFFIFLKRRVMQKLVLDIEESRYALLLQFLRTLDYVKIVQAIPNQPSITVQKSAANPANQLELLQQALQQQSKPPFQEIPDPLNWQKQQRNEWS
jgi:hypothetical protein